MIKDLIDCDNPVNYACFVIENITIEIIIGLNARVFAIKIVASLILEADKIDKDNIYKDMVLT